MVTIDDVRDRLLKPDQALEKLAWLDNLKQTELPTDGSTPVEFVLKEAFSDGLKEMPDDGVVGGASVSVGGTEIGLTKRALLEATSAIGLTKDYVSRTPGNLIEPQLNYWFSNGRRNLKLLTSSNGKTYGVATVRAAFDPYSTTRFAQEALGAIAKVYGEDTEVLVDAKLAASLDSTAIRMLIPDSEISIGSKTAAEDGNDPWAAGIAISNSPSGLHPAVVRGYLFRYWCTNGATTEHTAVTVHRRKRNEDAEEAYTWARGAAEEALGQVKAELTYLETLTKIELKGEVADTLAALYERYGVPASARQRILDTLVESDDLTAYGLACAITAAANAEDASAAEVERLMSVGGSVSHAMAGRCPQCHRI